MNTMLPIGSVVELENDEKKYVILGYFHQEVNDNKLNIYQYTACEYSLGFDDSNDLVYFDEDKIDSLVFMGYTIQFDRLFLRMLYDVYEALDGCKNIEDLMDEVLNKYFKDDEVKKKEIKEMTIGIYNKKEEGGSNEK